MAYNFLVQSKSNPRVVQEARNTDHVTLTTLSNVWIFLNRAAVKGFHREGYTLVMELLNGQKVRINNYFRDQRGPNDSEIFVIDDGRGYRVKLDTCLNNFQFEPTSMVPSVSSSGRSSLGARAGEHEADKSSLEASYQDGS